MNFSKRYGYVNPEDIIIREKINESIINAISDWFYRLKKCSAHNYSNIEKAVWVYFFNKKISDYESCKPIVIDPFICNKDNVWYEKLDLIEFVCRKLKPLAKDNYNDCIALLNADFKRHNFAYRIIDVQVVEMTSEEEIASVKEIIQNPINSVKTHINTALELISPSKENPDYRNSIKESISAVEACCREITGESTLGKALSRLEAKGVVINSEMKKGFEILYRYTNLKDTGIRHALMDDENAPTSDEAIYMLVTCSAFINYLTKKK